MSKLRNILAVFVAALTALAVTPAFAATITINKPEGQTGTDSTTYQYYKILDAHKGTGDAVSYTIPSNDAWVSVLQDYASEYLTLTQSADGTVYVVTAKGDLAS